LRPRGGTSAEAYQEESPPSSALLEGFSTENWQGRKVIPVPMGPHWSVIPGVVGWLDFMRQQDAGKDVQSIAFGDGIAVLSNCRICLTTESSVAHDA
jgi:hypothetical protein